MNLGEKIRAESADQILENYISKKRSYNLMDKCRVVNLSLWAEPLSLFELRPEVEYLIEKLERVGLYRIRVHFTEDPCRK
jgi:hypothetical protein